MSYFFMPRPVLEGKNKGWENNGKQPALGQLRRRLVSVIPTPSTIALAVREPEWISGELRSARGGLRGGQRGRFRGGQWGGRGAEPMEGPSPLPLLAEK